MKRNGPHKDHQGTRGQARYAELQPETEGAQPKNLDSKHKLVFLPKQKTEKLYLSGNKRNHTSD